MISIITTFFNAERYILDCILSVQKSKNFRQIEHILINDGSTDASEEIVRASCKANQILINSKKIGRGKALNLGLTYAKHDLISILDSDDMINPGWIDAFFESKIKALLYDEDNFVFFGKNEIIDEMGASRKRFISSPQIKFSNKLKKNKLFFFNPVPHLGVVFRKPNIPSLMYSSTLSSQLDWDLWFRILEANKDFIFIDLLSGMKRLHKDQSFERNKHIRYTLSGVKLQTIWTYRMQPLLLPMVIIVALARIFWAFIPPKLRYLVYRF